MHTFWGTGKNYFKEGSTASVFCFFPPFSLIQVCVCHACMHVGVSCLLLMMRTKSRKILSLANSVILNIFSQLLLGELHFKIL